MKPRNKKEVEVSDLYYLLPQITLAQKNDARKRLAGVSMSEPKSEIKSSKDFITNLDFMGGKRGF